MDSFWDVTLYITQEKHAKQQIRNLFLSESRMSYDAWAMDASSTVPGVTCYNVSDWRIPILNYGSVPEEGQRDGCIYRYVVSTQILVNRLLENIGPFDTIS